MGTTGVLGVTGENTRLTVQRALGIDGFAERVISVQDGGRLNIDQRFDHLRFPVETNLREGIPVRRSPGGAY